jgi:hypothetical protein
MKKFLFLLAVATAAGCQPYVAAQMDLVTQARRGVALTQKSFDERSRTVADALSLRRRLLDEAFDDDVRQRSPDALTPAWVIEHRKAYAAGLDALNTQAVASRDADAADRRNLAAVDDALKQLAWLASVQLKWSGILDDATTKEVRP